MPGVAFFVNTISRNAHHSLIFNFIGIRRGLVHVCSDAARIPRWKEKKSEINGRIKISNVNNVRHRTETVRSPFAMKTNRKRISKCFPNKRIECERTSCWPNVQIKFSRRNRECLHWSPTVFLSLFCYTERKKSFLVVRTLFSASARRNHISATNERFKQILIFVFFFLFYRFFHPRVDGRCLPFHTKLHAKNKRTRRAQHRIIISIYFGEYINWPRTAVAATKCPPKQWP